MLNKESTRLGDMEHELATSRELTVVSAHLEARFTDYVESEEWRLVDHCGRELPILCPILRGDGELV